MENKLVNMNKASITKAGVQKVTETYVNSITAHLNTIHIDVRPAQTQAIMFGIQKLNAMIDAKREEKLTLSDLDFSSTTSALTMVALTEINMMSFKPDGYFELRKDYKANKYTVNFQPQGNGVRTLVQKFGVGVKKVYDPWIVREGDELIYPHFKGLEMTPPEWTPKGDGKTTRVVVPIEYEDGHVEYKIAERESAKQNLLAHISNNLTNGAKENRNIEGFKKLVDKSANMTLDQCCEDNEFVVVGKMSPSWRGINREEMIITKLIKNALKRVPIDLEFYNVTQMDGDSPIMDEEASIFDFSNQDIANTAPEEESTDKPLPTIEDKKPATPTTPKTAEKVTTAPATDSGMTAEDDEEMPF